MKKTHNLKTQAPVQSLAFFKDKRKEFCSRLPDNCIAIIVSNPEQTRSNDTEYLYRQSSDVLYLSGFPEPESVLLFVKRKGKTRFIMFVLPKDAERETWTGRRFGVKGATRNFRCAEAHTIEEFPSVLAKLLPETEQVFYKFGRNERIDNLFRKEWLKDQKPLNNPEDILHPLRHVKQPDELELMRHAAEISARAHCAAMLAVRPGWHEYQVMGVIEGFCADNGAPEMAYNTIAAGGNNAVILHYTTNYTELLDGDLLLVDAACEYRGYAADITRTYPVNGKFSKAQKQVYEVVLAAQMAAIRAAKPGSMLNTVHAAAEKVLRRGLVKLGILKKGMESAKTHDEVVERATKKKRLDKTAHLGRFFMHGTSHWLGLDVHDVSGLEKKESKTLRLAPGMVLTVEPGLYLPADDKLVPRKFRGIGIRIEDDVVITEDGCEVITASVPKTVADIEILMASSSQE